MIDTASAQILTASDIQEEFDDSHLFPEKSTILYELIEGDSYMFERYDPILKKRVSAELDFGEIQFEGGSAAIEQEVGMLEYSVASMIHDPHLKTGWWVMESFYGTYSKDYFGEVDCSFEYSEIRRARYADLHKFGCLTIPYQRILFALGLNLKA